MKNHGGWWVMGHFWKQHDTYHGDAPNLGQKIFVHPWCLITCLVCFVDDEDARWAWGEKERDCTKMGHHQKHLISRKFWWRMCVFKYHVLNCNSLSPSWEGYSFLMQGILFHGAIFHSMVGSSRWVLPFLEWVVPFPIILAIGKIKKFFTSSHGATPLDKGITRIGLALNYCLSLPFLLVMPLSLGITLHLNIHRSWGIGGGRFLHLLLKSGSDLRLYK